MQEWKEAAFHEFRNHTSQADGAVGSWGRSGVTFTLKYGEDVGETKGGRGIASTQKGAEEVGEKGVKAGTSVNEEEGRDIIGPCSRMSIELFACSLDCSSCDLGHISVTLARFAFLCFLLTVNEFIYQLLHSGIEVWETREGADIGIVCSHELGCL